MDVGSVYRFGRVCRQGCARRDRATERAARVLDYSGRARVRLRARGVPRSDGGPACVIPASSENQPSSVVVSVYLFPAGADPTTYKGAFIAGFMRSGGRPHETKIDYTIKPGQRPSFVSSAGRVTSTPGDYEFQMALFADVPGHADPHQFQQKIPVRVVGPAPTRTD